MPANSSRRSALMTVLLPRPELVHITDLRPTQITVGLAEIAHKRLRWHEPPEKTGRRGMSLRAAPVVRGPHGALYLLDRHHLVRAAREEGVREILVRPIANFTTLEPDEFWSELDARGWCHPYDAQGRRRPFGEIPGEIDALVDDPFRSLAGALRRAGGFSKQRSAFSEFAWADFLRVHMPGYPVTADLKGALEHALKLARSQAARGLQGWKSEAELSWNERASPALPNASC